MNGHADGQEEEEEMTNGKTKLSLGNEKDRAMGYKKEKSQKAFE